MSELPPASQPPPDAAPTGYAVSAEGVFLPHALWDQFLEASLKLTQQNEQLLLTVASLLANSAFPPDRYDLRALQEML